MIILILFIWLPLCLVVGSTARSRGRSFLGFSLLSALLSPLIGLVILLCLSPLTAATRGEPGA
jgi:hypothetical protein